MKRILYTLLLASVLLGNVFTSSIFATPSEQKVVFWNTGDLAEENDEAWQYLQLFKGMYDELGYDVVETTGEFLTESDIDGITLLVLYFPLRDITTEEIALVNEYLDTKGVLILYGENNNWVPEINARLSALASTLGTSFTFTDNDSADGTILSPSNGINSTHPVNEDVTKFGINYIPVIEYSQPAKVIIADLSGYPVILEQPLSNGTIILMVDINIFDYTDDETDLKTMLGNIVNYSQARQDGTLPQTSDTGLKLGWLVLLGLGLIFVSKIKSKA